MPPTYTTTTRTGLRWLTGSNLVRDIDAGFQALAEDVDNQLSPLVSTLPTTGLVDGMQVYYQNAAMAALSTMWHLRYRSAATTYKWEFVGGPQMHQGPSGSMSYAVATTKAALTSGPTLTAPLAGIYLAHFRMRSNATAGTNVLTGYIAVNGTFVASTAAAWSGGTASEATEASMHANSSRMTLAAADVLTIQVQLSAATSANFFDGVLELLPCAVI